VGGPDPRACTTPCSPCTRSLAARCRPTSPNSPTAWSTACRARANVYDVPTNSRLFALRQVFQTSTPSSPSTTSPPVSASRHQRLLLEDLVNVTVSIRLIFAQEAIPTSPTATRGYECNTCSVTASCLDERGYNGERVDHATRATRFSTAASEDAPSCRRPARRFPSFAAFQRRSTPCRSRSPRPVPP